jgi:pimeloyl-ACP methyl ester carboxylesterase
MPFAESGGVRLYYEETGSGQPLVFVHEFSGDSRSWEAQVRFFCRRYRCVTFNARGYPPSDVPEDPAAYSQEAAVDDIVAVLDHLNFERAHVVGLSMGAFAVLHLALIHAARTRSIVVAGCGYGVTRDPADASKWREETEALATRYQNYGAEAARAHAIAPSRVPFQNKDPRGWAEFAAQFYEHSYLGAALTLRGVQKERPSLFGMEAALRSLEVPTLIINGDEDDACLEPGIWLKRTMPWSALCVFPKAGHTLNLEEPELFNRTLADFLSAVDLDRWGPRDPRSSAPHLLGR